MTACMGTTALPKEKNIRSACMRACMDHSICLSIAIRAEPTTCVYILKLIVITKKKTMRESRLYIYSGMMSLYYRSPLVHAIYRVVKIKSDLPFILLFTDWTGTRSPYLLVVVCTVPADLAVTRIISYSRLRLFHLTYLADFYLSVWEQLIIVHFSPV